MPLYDYRCRHCGETFDRLRPSREADAPVRCGSGHDDTVRLLSLVAQRRTGGSASPGASPQAGGCCGGGCCAPTG